MRPPFLNDFGMKKGACSDHEGTPPESLKPLKYLRFRCSVPVKKHARSSLTGGGGFPCRALMIRAQIWWIRAKKYGALFGRKKRRLRQRTHKSRASKNMGPFFAEKKRRLRQRTHKSRASRNMGPFFAGKKAPAATYPQVKGFQKFGPLGIQAEKQGFRTAWLITGQKFP